MKNFILDYIDENEFNKLEKSIKKYNMRAYKMMYFEFYPSLKTGKLLGEKIETNSKEKYDTYELKLPSDSMFSRVHGETKLRYLHYTEENIIMLDTITPTEILMEGHMSELPTYKGVMISKKNSAKDKFKIDYITAMQGD